MALSSPPLHVLMVAPRPSDSDIVPSLDRLVALYDALQARGDLVEIEWLWPPTLDTLSERLSDDLAPRIDVLCLDVPFEEGPVFEESDGRGAPIAVSALAALLNQGPVSLCLLVVQPDWADALADHTDTHLLWLSPALSQHAVRLVSAAFFSAMLSGLRLSDALAQAQASLAASERNPVRLSAGGCDLSPSELVRLHLADSGQVLVQVTPDPQADRGPVVPDSDDDLEPAWRAVAELPEPGGLPATTDLGFVGRARELSALERALDYAGMAQPIWVYGYAGVGKTMLLGHLARWLVRTGRFGQVVYTDFSGGAMPEEALYDLGVRLLGDSFVPSNSEAIPRLVEALASQSTLIIWDGLEGILGDAEFPLGRDGLSELFGLARQFSETGASRICLISDTPALPTESRLLGELSMSLGLAGMQADDAVTLLGQVWSLARLPMPSASEARSLSASLGGHPLALQTLASATSGRGLQAALEELSEILPGWRSGDAQLRNQGLEACLELLMRSWDADSRGQLARLGGLRKGFMEPLGQRAMGLDAGFWAGAKKRLTSASLVSDQVLPGFSVPYVRMHSALEGFLRRRLAVSQLASLEAAYQGNYAGLLKWLIDAESRSPAFSRAMGRRELPNFRHALTSMLARDQLTAATEFVRNLSHLLGRLGLTGEAQRARAALEGAIKAALPEEGPFGRAGVRFLIDRSERLTEARQLPQALGLLQQLGQRMGQEKGISYSGDEATLDRALVLHRLGRAMRSLGRPEAVLSVYNQAQDLLTSAPISDVVRRQRLDLLQDMAEATLMANQPVEAERLAERGLALALQMDDRRALGVLHRQMGLIKTASQSPDEAMQHLEAALAEFTSLEDAENQISLRQQMGGLALQGGEAAPAEEHLLQALEISRSGELPLAEAQLLLQLAQVHEAVGQADEALSDFEASIALFAQQRQPAAQASAQVGLAELLLRLGRPDDARPHAEAARALVDDLGPNAQPWTVYALLQRITAEQGDERASDRWRVRAQHAFISSPAAEAVRERWSVLIDSVAASCRGAALDLDTVQTVEQLEANEQWRGLAAALWRLLGGERGSELYESLDHIDATIVRAIVDAIEEPPSGDAHEEEDQ